MTDQLINKLFKLSQSAGYVSKDPNYGKSKRTALSIIKYTAVNMAKAATTMLLAGALGDVDAMLGPLPLYNIQVYEIGYSLEELKFRAAKGQYFKQQKGHEMNLRIDLTVSGPYREFYLSLLETMYALGSLQARKLLYSFNSNITTSITGSQSSTGMADVLTGGLVSLSAKSSPVMGPAFNQTQAGPLKSVVNNKLTKVEDIHDLYEEQDEWRDSYTFMSSNDILFDVYIQNFVVERSVRGGQNAIYVSLFLNKFEQPPIIKITQTAQVSDTTSSTSINTKTYRIRESKGVTTNPLNENGKVFFPCGYLNKNNKIIRYTTNTFFSSRVKNSPEISALNSQTLSGQDYSFTTERSEKAPYKPEKSEWIDLAIRAAWRIFSTTKKFKQRDIYLSIRDTGLWNLNIEYESTRTPGNVSHRVAYNYTPSEDPVSSMRDLKWGLLE